MSVVPVPLVRRDRRPFRAKTLPVGRQLLPRPAISCRSADPCLLPKLLIRGDFSLWHNACDCLHEFGRGARLGPREAKVEQWYGYLRRTEHLGRGPAGAVLCATEHFRERKSVV